MNVAANKYCKVDNQVPMSLRSLFHLFLRSVKYDFKLIIKYLKN